MYSASSGPAANSGWARKSAFSNAIAWEFPERVARPVYVIFLHHGES
jgi:hypothetical protein